MRKSLTIMQRELGAYFYSPIAYAVLTIFMIVCGIFFLTQSFTPGGEASLKGLTNVMPVLLVVFLPIITMRLLSEEFRGGTIETLMTAPVGEGSVVMGKFLGALVFYLVMLGLTLIYAVLVRLFGRLDFGALMSTYLGLLFLGALYLAVGLFFSACTMNQIIAAVGSIVLLLVFTFLADYLARDAQGFLGLMLHHLSLDSHYRDFTLGMVDTNHVIFFLTSIGLFLFLAVKALESRRWR
jgi:ABC-2 type transport system permease protein